MEYQPKAKRSYIKRIGGYLHRVIPIQDKSGDVISYSLKPHMVEFRLRDIFQVMIGAAILAIPIAFTEEAWILGERLPTSNIVFLAVLSIVLITLFVYFNFYNRWIEGNVFNFLQRVMGTYIIAFLVVGFILTLIQKCPWGVDNLLAIKRIIIVTFPASMSATVSDTIK